MTFDPRGVMGLDIETFNKPCETLCDTYASRGDAQCFGHGLEPERSRITEIALARDDDEGEVFTGDEAKILTDLDRYLRSRANPGVIATWNGIFFDFPFIHDRARTLGVATGLRMITAPALRPKYQPLPGHGTAENPGGGYHVYWGSTLEGVPHVVLDVAQPYRAFAESAGVKHSLKPVAEAKGLPMFEVPEGFADADDFRTRLHDARPEDTHDYAMSDARQARVLALMLMGLAA